MWFRLVFPGYSKGITGVNHSGMKTGSQSLEWGWGTSQEKVENL